MAAKKTRIIQYTGGGEHAGTFDFALYKVKGYLRKLIKETKPHRYETDTPRVGLYKAYLGLFDEIIALEESTKHYILELDQDPRMDFLAAALIDDISYIVFCAECMEEYPSQEIKKELIVDPADPLAPHNGRSYCCPKGHEVLFVPDLIQT